MHTQDVKRRIRSVKSTQQITRAMKFVAAAKLRRAQEAMLAMRPYADAIDGLLKHVAEDLVGDEHPLLRARASVSRVAYVLIAADRGLAGGFNNNLFRVAGEYVRARSGQSPRFYAVGKRTTSYLRKAGFTILRSYHDVFDKLSYVMAGDVCDDLVRRFADSGPEGIDEAYVIYNEFASLLTQRPVIRRLLPLSVGEMRRTHEAGHAAAGSDAGMAAVPAGSGAVLEEIVLEEAPDDVFDIADAEEELLAEEGEIAAAAAPRSVRPVYELLPDVDAALGKLMARRMATEVYRALLESHAAELAARMTAMDSSTANAEEMVAELTLELNRARQFAITTELLDIIGGANAL